MHKTFLTSAAYLGALSVAFGAFGAHALKEMLNPDALAIYETAVRYQFYHVFALLATGILYSYFPNKFISAAGKLFITGIVLFCGSLYALVFIKNAGNTGLYWVGAVTPLGGLGFIAGWVCVAIGIKPPSPKGAL
jgi:uncharacterized membrane protein YgdD (TMEM256/DUF423 family)